MAFTAIQRTFDTTGARLERTLTSRLHGGYITVEASFDAVNWVQTDIVDRDGGFVLFQGVAKIRITPFNGAEYEYI